MQIYAELVADRPATTDSELRPALLRAAVALFEQADSLVRDQRFSDAHQAWELLDLAVPWIDQGEVLGAALAARRAVARLAADPGSTDDLVVVLRNPDLGSRVLADAISLFATDAASLWSLYDGLTQLAGQDGDFSLEERSTFAWLASEIPLAQAYRLGRDVEPQTAAKRLVSAVDVRLGSAHHGLDGELKKRIRGLRDALAAEMGVAIPGVRRDLDDEGRSDRVDFLIYQELVAYRTIDPEVADPVALIIETFDRVLRDQLHRLIGPDDVRLWLAGWQPTSRAPAAWNPSDPPRARLRLVRVLRMLLREGVAIGEVDLIVRTFAQAEDAGGGPVDTLRAVRAALGPAALGAPPGRAQHRLPADLQARIRAGLDAESDQRWERPREETVALVRDLHGWLAGQTAPAADEPVVVVVSDPSVRLYAWRLLAGAQNPLRVLAEGELS